MTDPLISRRRALAGAAVGGLSLPVLAACGPGTSDGQNAGNLPARGAEIVPTSQVPVGGGVVLGDEDVVVTQPKKGTFEGFSATCTHEGCLLSSVAGGTINCSCHGSQFSITDGSNVAGPSGQPAGSVAALPRVPVKVKGPSIVRT